MRQLEIHFRENNPESEAFLGENKAHFTAQCSRVLELLRVGVRLTTLTAAKDYGILSLARRIKDLVDYNGIQIQWQWINERGVKVKEWYLSQSS